MNTQEFLERILPRQGVYYAAYFPNKDNLFCCHKACFSIPELASTLLSLDKRYYAVFHACASYKQATIIGSNGKKKSYRVAKNCHSVRSFWIDLDVGEAKAKEGKGYASQKEAIQALAAFCRKYKLPTPMLVSSGYGVHAYFTLDQDIDGAEWTSTATILKALLNNEKVLADPSRTADVASILRPVGTANKKRGISMPVYVITPGTANVSYTRFKDVLTAAAKELSLNVRKPNGMADDFTAEPEDPSVKKLWNSDYVRDLSIKADADRCCQGCEQMRIMRNTKGDVSYDTLQNVIGVLRHCVDGYRIACEWTANRREKHDQGVEAVDRLWNTLSAPFATSCATFEANNPEPCRRCPNRGKVFNPANLGRLSDAQLLSMELLHNADSKEHAPEGQTTEAESPEAPKTSAQAAVEYAQSQGEDPILLPTGFSWAEGLGMMMDGDGDKEPVVFAGTYFHIIDRWDDDQGRENYKFRSIDPNSHAIKEFDFRGGLTSGTQKVKECLGDQGIQTYPRGDFAMVAYIIKSIEQLRKNVCTKKAASSFGWQPEDGSIVLGNRKFEAGKPISTARLAGDLRDNKTAFTAPVGTVAGYVEALNAFYNRRYMEPLQYAMCSIWGSLLVELSNPEYYGIPCALTGAKSGIGKTTVVKVAMQAFSDSDDFAMKSFNGATASALYGRLAMFKSFGVLFDELTVRGDRRQASEKLSEFAYSLAHGAERVKSVQKSSGWVPGKTKTWKSQSVITGNTNWLDILNHGNANLDPESMRIFEINTDDYPNIPSLSNPKQVSDWVTQLRNNSGPVGELYCQFLVDNQDTLRKALADFYTNHPCPPELEDAKFRFYRYHIACTITAAEIMKKLGVIQFDLKALYSFALDAALSLIRKSSLRNMDALEKIRSFLTAMAPWTMTTEHYDNGPFEAQAGKQLRAPQDRIIKVRRIYTPKNCSRKTTKDARVLDNTIMLYSSALQEWLTSESQGSYDTLRKQLEVAGVLKQKDIKRRYSLGKGLSEYCTGEQDTCLVLDLTKVSPDFFEE